VIVRDKNDAILAYQMGFEYLAKFDFQINYLAYRSLADIDRIEIEMTESSGVNYKGKSQRIELRELVINNHVVLS